MAGTENAVELMRVVVERLAEAVRADAVAVTEQGRIVAVRRPGRLEQVRSSRNYVSAAIVRPSPELVDVQDDDQGREAGTLGG